MDGDLLKKRLDKTYELRRERNIHRSCIAINGKWGIGKTYVIEKFMEENKGSNKISLFGISSLEELKKVIIMRYLFPTLEKGDSSSILKAFKSMGKDIFNKKTGINLETIITVQRVDNIKFKNKNVLIFDDIERINDKIDFKEFLGFVERISLKTNVIIIYNEDKLNPKNQELLKEYQEKVITSTFILDEISQNTLESCLKYNGIVDIKEIRTFITLFKKYEWKNLRIIEKLMDFYNELEIEFEEEQILKDNKVNILEGIFLVLLEDIELYFSNKYRKEEELNIKNNEKTKKEIAENINENINNHYYFLNLNNNSLVILLYNFYKSRNFDIKKLTDLLKTIELNQEMNRMKDSRMDYHLTSYSSKKENFEEIINFLLINRINNYNSYNFTLLYENLFELESCYNELIIPKQIEEEFKNSDCVKNNRTTFGHLQNKKISNLKKDIIEKMNNKIELIYYSKYKNKDIKNLLCYKWATDLEEYSNNDFLGKEKELLILEEYREILKDEIIESEYTFFVNLFKKLSVDLKEKIRKDIKERIKDKNPHIKERCEFITESE